MAKQCPHAQLHLIANIDLSHKNMFQFAVMSYALFIEWRPPLFPGAWVYVLGRICQICAHTMKSNGWFHLRRQTVDDCSYQPIATLLEKSRLHRNKCSIRRISTNARHQRDMTIESIILDKIINDWRFNRCNYIPKRTTISTRTSTSYMISSTAMTILCCELKSENF